VEREQELHLDVEVTREEFEEAIIDLISKTEETVNLALTNSKLTIDDIDKGYLSWRINLGSGS